MTCKPISDRYNNWSKPIRTITLNPKFNDTHPYLQNCSVWSIDFRNNDTYCPAVMRPDCYLLNSDKYDKKCPFGTNDRKNYLTQEYCECLGLQKELMPIGHKVNCTCTRNLAKDALTDLSKNCYEYFLFTKECVVHRPYQRNITDRTTGQNKTVNRYYFNCSFVNCHDIDALPLIQVTGFNTTCSNGTSMAQTLSTTVRPPTTTKKKPTPTTRNLFMSISPKRRFGQNNGSIHISNNPIDAVSPNIHNTELVALEDGNLEYSKQAKEGSLFGFMVFAAILQVILMLFIGYGIRTRKGQYYERKFREYTTMRKKKPLEESPQ